MAAPVIEADLLSKIANLKLQNEQLNAKNEQMQREIEEINNLWEVLVQKVDTDVKEIVKLQNALNQALEAGEISAKGREELIQKLEIMTTKKENETIQVVAVSTLASFVTFGLGSVSCAIVFGGFAVYKVSTLQKYREDKTT